MWELQPGTISPRLVGLLCPTEGWCEGDSNKHVDDLAPLWRLTTHLGCYCFGVGPFSLIASFFIRSGLLFIGNTPILGWCNEMVGSVSNDIWEQQKCGRERVNYLFFLILLWCVGYVNSKQICSSMNSFRLFAWLYINMVKADKKYIVFHCKHNIMNIKLSLLLKP